MSFGNPNYVLYNPNPEHHYTDDCTVRAISKCLNISWYEAFDALAKTGREMGVMPSTNAVWGDYLKRRGFVRRIIPDTCPSDCYSVLQFCLENPTGLYVLATGTHVVTVIDGKYYDSWDSGDEVPIYYYRKRGERDAV